jgi:hypothetical protein
LRRFLAALPFSPQVTLGALYELFSVYGKVQKIAIFDGRSPQTTGNTACQQAFVQFPTVESAVMAWGAVDSFE